MQLYALDQSALILASHASRSRSYRCPECQGLVRTRGGGRRHVHFYHIRRPAACRQSGKSLAHLQIQLHLKSLITPLKLENRFEKRIADAVWEDEKIVFEIQCSFLSFEEAKQRGEDYKRLGYTPVWILHDRRFNQRRLSAAEMYLRAETTTFFTDGQNFYDQFEACIKNRRVFQGPRLKVELTEPRKKVLQPLLSRSWALSFNGDLYHLAEYQDLSHYKKLLSRLKKRYRWRRFKRGYQLWFYRLLEMVC